MKENLILTFLSDKADSKDSRFKVSASSEFLVNLHCIGQEFINEMSSRYFGLIASLIISDLKKSDPLMILRSQSPHSKLSQKICLNSSSRFLILRLLNLDFGKREWKLLENMNSDVLKFLSPVVEFTGANQAIKSDAKTVKGERHFFFQNRVSNFFFRADVV